ncbi:MULTISPECIES: hypothetical protein [Okeania]|uniref:hypothetical protein n=1 Tax=Okeania TaxID=1458928 RepID=UPI0013750388|nr:MULTISPECIES: hypothetical protein [Okeania]NEP04053.1 hypothetical protein [Okeania sp. SIO4D6]NEP73134.1 hypothetical protein [Okeania sp. SIO2G5]NEP93957.1 hypothetical protein [Okeania sp. SIO2F5]NES76438.1 hypothetical protein [Okeania sp. SIO1H4]NET21780.1 hypothetical protein [Okeania sp. SIO1H5]
MLDLQQASISSSNTNFWLETAVKSQDEFNKFLWSLEASGYYNSPSDVSSKITR